MNRKLKISRFINVIYGLMGLIILILIVYRLYEEEIQNCLCYRYGLKLGITIFFSSLLLGISQILDFLRIRYSFEVLLVSFFLSILVIFLSVQTGHIWSPSQDFIVFLAIDTILFIPPFLSKRLRKTINNFSNKQ